MKSRVNSAAVLDYSVVMMNNSFHIFAMRKFTWPILCSALFLASCAPVEVPVKAPVKETVLAPKSQEVTAEADNQSLTQTSTDKTTATTNESLIAEIDSVVKAREEAKEKAEAEKTADNATDDVIASIIWELEKGDNQTKVETQTLSFEELIPEGRDPSLEEAALDAAFAMLRAPKDAPLSQRYEIPEKAAGQRRIGVFVPLSGERAIYGNQVADGLELAMFQINDPDIEILYFDTSSTDALGSLAQQAIKTQIDIAIGPLFSDNAKDIAPYLSADMIPVLSLSNNRAIASPGLWVLGLLPEQQIDKVLAESILNGHDEIAILSDQSAYGAMVTSHAVKRLQEFGISPASVMVVDGTVGADDETLVTQLKRFTRYQPLEDGQLVEDIPPPYDSVVIAGGANFVLKVAPLLSYYDLGPDRVNYLGTDLWANAGLLAEPSLQGAYLSTLSPDLRANFAKRYDELYKIRGSSSAGSFLSQLGFDAFAVAASASDKASAVTDNETQSLQLPIISQLVKESGFKGYTGSFRLLANGLNHRDYRLFQVQDGKLAPVAMMPKAPEAYNSDEVVLQN